MLLKRVIVIFLIFAKGAICLAQGFDQKKIAQRRDVFINNNWVGQDSVVWDYNSNQDITYRESKTFNNTWNNFNRDLNTYNTNNKLSQTLYQEYVNGAWKNVYQYNYVYDANDNEIEFNRKSWNGTTWLDNSRYVRTFSGTNKILTETIQQYSGGTWVDFFNKNYTYDITTNDLFEVIHQSNLGSGLVNDFKERFIFTPSKKIFEYTRLLPGTNSNWVHANSYVRNYNSYDSIIQENGFKDSLVVNDYKYNYTYNAQRQVLDITHLKADSFGLFFNYALTGFNYNADTLLTEKVYSFFPFGTAVIDSSEEYTYTNKLLTKADYFGYQPGGKTLINSYTYNYDGFNNRTYLLYKSLVNNNFSNKRQEFYYYNQFLLALQNQALIGSLKLYPNPAADFININTIITTTSKLLQIFNNCGQLVLSTNIPAAFATDVINIQSLNSGSYQLKLQTHSGFAVSNFIKK